MKLSYTARQLEPVGIPKRGAPKGNTNASKPDSEKSKKVQGYISPRQLEVLIALEKKMSKFCAKKRLRSHVIGTAIEFLSMLIETVPVFMLGEETMNSFLIAHEKNIWTVVDVAQGTVYVVEPDNDNVLKFSMTTPCDTVQWTGPEGVQLAAQFAQMVMARKSDQLGQSFNMAVKAMVEPQQ